MNIGKVVRSFAPFVAYRLGLAVLVLGVLAVRG
jgi:hypothetical protein